MSYDTINWAKRCPINRSSDKFLLVMLAVAADENNVCYPSQAALVEETAQDPKTVRLGLRRLQEAGYIVDTEERKGTGNQIVVWRLVLPKKVGSKEGEKRHPTENGSLPFLDLPPTKIPVLPSQKRMGEQPRTTKEQPSRVSAPKAARKTGTRIPDDWKLTKELRDYAVAHGVEPALAAEEFWNYWSSATKNAAKLDWDKTFQNRIIALSDAGKFKLQHSSPTTRATAGVSV